MCDFLSFVLCDKGDGRGLHAFTDKSLSSHGDACIEWGLTPFPHSEVEWSADNNILIRLGEVPEGKREAYTDWIRSRWSSREACSEYFVRDYLKRGQMPDVSNLTWLRPVLIQWASDCAEHILHIYEDKYPGDDRPRKAIEAARSGNKNAADAADAADAARAAHERKWQAAKLLDYLDGKAEMPEVGE